MQYKNTIILGDFNIHTNDSMDANASIFQDIMAATGLSQWVDFPTHKLGNTLDLVFTKCSSNIAVSSFTQGPLGSDHFAVEMSQHTKSSTQMSRTAVSEYQIHRCQIVWEGH